MLGNKTMTKMMEVNTSNYWTVVNQSESLNCTKHIIKFHYLKYLQLGTVMILDILTMVTRTELPPLRVHLL